MGEGQRPALRRQTTRVRTHEVHQPVEDDAGDAALHERNGQLQHGVGEDVAEWVHHAKLDVLVRDPLVGHRERQLALVGEGERHWMGEEAESGKGW